MSIELKMPALSPTMEEGTLAKWLVGVGDLVKPGDLIAEIETDKATMEYEAIDEGRVTAILVDEGTDGVAVGTIIATLSAAEDAAAEGVAAPAVTEPMELRPAPAAPSTPPTPHASSPRPAPVLPTGPVDEPPLAPPPPRPFGTAAASPLAMRIADFRNIDLDKIDGSGPRGRIVRKDLGLALPDAAAAPSIAPLPEVRQDPPQAPGSPTPDLAHELVKMSNMRKTIARRLTESKQQIPHIYLSVDVHLDALFALRAQFNEAGAARGTKVSVNDMVIKALALALIEVPACNVQFAGDRFLQFRQADISVAVSIPGGLITPVISAAEAKSLSAIAAEMKDLAERARAGKLKPHEFQGGTASLSNLGMFGITDFAAVINPPQAMIMAVGAAEKRPCVKDDVVCAATMMTATGSFDHRVIDGADAAAFMQAFRRSLESPLLLV
jgi:pyruvate dehydrogenase E2 component (dihydrolipoamide acetyltransferase)